MQVKEKTFRLTLDQVEGLARQKLGSFGFAPALASTLAHHIRSAEHNGLAAHGLAMLPRYMACAETGQINLAPTPRISMSRSGLMVLDCDNSFAPYALREVRRAFIECVREQGVASIVTQNAHHLSVLGLDILPLAEDGLIAIAMSGTAPWVVPHGGDRPILGTNPFSFACPRRDREPILWDQASSITSISDVRIAQQQGRRMNTKVGLDQQGRLTDDPEEILASGKLLPFGGHKGSAIALMVELLTAGLSGGRFAVDYDRSQSGPTNSTGQFYMAIDPATVSGNFTAHIETVLREFTDNGAARIPGDGRFVRQQRAETEGIAISESLWDKFAEWG